MTIEEALEVYEPKTYITSKGDNILKIIDNLYDSRDSIYYYVLDALNSNVNTTNYLKFVPAGSSTDTYSISLTQEGTWSGSWPIQVSSDGVSWVDYTLGTTISLAVGNVVYFRGQKDGTAQTTSNYRKFVMTGSIAASGDCTSLLNGIGGVDDLTLYGEYTFFRLFRYCSIISVPSLPATTLDNKCYHSMFAGCTSLITVPSDLLPATTLSILCYDSMFYGCTYLTTPPSLPATTLANSCYSGMFYGCTHLEGPVNISAPSPYYTGTSTACSQMFSFSGASRATGSDNHIYVGGNVSDWNSSTAGIDSTYWTVQLQTETSSVEMSVLSDSPEMLSAEIDSIEMDTISDSFEVDSPEVEVLSDSPEAVSTASYQEVFTPNSDSSFIVDDWYPEGGFPAGKSILYFPKEICALIYEVTG